MSGCGSTVGTVVAAISGVEMAFWDVKGKALGTPIYNLLGGRYRTKIRVFADCGHGEEPNYTRGMVGGTADSGLQQRAGPDDQAAWPRA